MKNFVIYPLVFAIFLQSCSSIIYSPQKRRENNRFEINSNVNNFSIIYSKNKNQSPTKIDWNKYRIEKLSRKNTFLTLSSPSYEDIKIKLNRSPRASILLLDLPSIVYLLGIPLVVDLVSANFYKIPQQRKVINVNFQRTNAYFKDKILNALNSSNEKILDEISNESPNREILNQIEITRNEIIRLKLLSDIKILNSTENSKYELYLALKSKYQNRSSVANNILDSLKLQIQFSEISNLKNNNDIIRLVKLYQIAEQDFLINLKQLKPEIEKNTFNEIVINYDFNLINELLRLDPDNKNNLLNVKKETEVHLINEVSQTNNFSLIDKHYDKLEEITKFKLDEIRVKVVETNKKNKLKSEIVEVNKLVANKNFKDALDKINSIYPNYFADDSEENINIKKIKKNASDNYENQKILESILFIDDEIYNGNFPFDNINNLFDNPFLSLSQKNNLTLVKKNLEIKYQKIKQLEAIEQAQIEKKQKIEDINRLKEEKKTKAEALSLKNTNIYNQQIDIGVLGVDLEQITPKIVTERNLKVSLGVVVVGFGEISPAKEEGMEINDVLLKINGQEIKDIVNCGQIIRSNTSGKKAKIVINRNGVQKEFLIGMVIKNIDYQTYEDRMINDASYYLKNNNFKSALEYFDMILKKNPDLYRARVGRLFSRIFYEDNSGIKSSISDLNKNIADATFIIDNKSIDTEKSVIRNCYAFRGACFIDIGKKKEACADFKNAFAFGDLEPSFAKIIEKQLNVCKDLEKVQNNRNSNGNIFVDQSGNSYKTVKIGSRIWMAENLKTNRYTNGEEIEFKSYIGYSNSSPVFSQLENGQYLYSWEAVKDSRGIAPDGWHVPTPSEWEELISYCKKESYDLNSTTGWPTFEKGGYYFQNQCPNCKNWNSEYKRKVACRTCMDTRYVRGSYVQSRKRSLNGNNRLKFNIENLGCYYDGKYFLRETFWTSDLDTSECKTPCNTSYIFVVNTAYGSAYEITSDYNYKYMLPIRLVKD